MHLLELDPTHVRRTDADSEPWYYEEWEHPAYQGKTWNCNPISRVGEFHTDDEGCD